MYRKLKVYSVLALVALLLSAASDVVAQKPSPLEQIFANYKQVQSDARLTDEEKIKNTIDTYFKLRYESRKLLKPLDFSFLMADTPQAQEWDQRERDKREIELYNAALYRLNYLKYDYFIDYKDIELKDGRANVWLSESHEVVFEAIAPQVSKLDGLEHVIRLVDTEVGWVIVDDKYKDELTRLMEHADKDSIIEHIQINHDLELQKAAHYKGSSESSEDLVSFSSVELNTLNTYDRSAAVDYADQWWTDRNPEWGNFDPPNGGGDCTNYVSQVIYAGAGHQMDQTGWYKWYYNGYNDRSPSWTDVGELYSYLIGNSPDPYNAIGPSGGSVAPCSVRRGDVVQLSADGDYWTHSMAVVWTYYPNQCWDLSYITANSHYDNGQQDYDRYHYPLSELSAYQKRYVRIYGWSN